MPATVPMMYNTPTIIAVFLLVPRGLPLIVFILSFLLFVVILHSDDYTSRFVSFFNIAVSFGRLFQGVTFVYDRFYFSCFNKLFDENQVFRAFG